VRLFAKAILCIPKTLINNSGHDITTIITRAQNAIGESDQAVGLDLENGSTFVPTTAGIYDIYAAKKQLIDASIVVVTNLLLTDEIMRAGLSSLK